MERVSHSTPLAVLSLVMNWVTTVTLDLVSITPPEPRKPKFAHAIKVEITTILVADPTIFVRTATTLGTRAASRAAELADTSVGRG